MAEPIIGYKSGGNNGNYLITLKIDPNESNINRKDVVNKDTAKYRCRKAFVVKIQHKDTEELVGSIESIYDSSFIYKSGIYVEEPRYNDDVDKVCSEGIHFFTTKEPALLYEYVPKNYNIYKAWHFNGQLYQEIEYKNGKREGLYKAWHKNGQLWEECEWKDGKIEGPYKSWHDNGQLKEECIYINGYREGPYKSWYENGKLHDEGEYKNGIQHSVNLWICW